MTRTNVKESLMFRAAGPQALLLLTWSAFNGGRGGEGRSYAHPGAHPGARPGARPRARATLFARLRRGLKRMAAGIARSRARRRAIDELSRLDDRLLSDIGLNRSNIAQAVDAAMERRLWQLEENHPVDIGSIGGDLRYRPETVLTHVRAANSNRARRSAA